MNDELKEILNNYEHLHVEVNNKSIYFDRLLGIITDLYIDKYKLLGQNVKHRATELVTLLTEDYSLENVLKFFET